MISAKVILDSISESGARLITMELKYPRFVHAELMTHRVFSRNAASSRAIPIRKVIKMVEEDPATPVYWGKNKRGMSPGKEVEDSSEAMKAWLEARDSAVEHARKLKELGLHKQIVNRLLEPFQYITVICTATQWSNFFALRDHADAQQEIAALAKKMKYAQEMSIPVERVWHMPYIQNNEMHLDPTELRKISTARCARVSYLTHDGTRSIDKDLELHKRLLTGGDSGHWSPFEHVAMASSDPGERSGNFTGWIQYRKMHGGECQ